MVLHFEFQESTECFPMKFCELDQQFDADFGEIQVVTKYLGEVYEGDYSVKPDAWEDTVLKTAHKMMSADLVVEKIPFAEVSNTANGTTVTIG